MKKIIIKAENLSKSYIVGKEGNNVLKNLSFEIYEGDFTVIMGTSGSGKSTMLYNISTMDKPTEGKIWLGDYEITAMTESELCKLRQKELSFIFQSINLLPDMNAFENIAYYAYGAMDKETANKKTDELLEKFGLTEHKNKFPSEMSGGQRQRIAIARSVIVDPKIVFADEPTGALNSLMGDEVLNELQSLNDNGQSIVMVTHDIKSACRGNRLIYLSDGKITGDLNLGKYSAEAHGDREKLIFDFLSKNNW